MSTTITHDKHAIAAESAEAITTEGEAPTAAPKPVSKTSKAAAKPVATLPDAYTRRDRAKLRLHAATGAPMNLLLDSSAVIEVTWRPLSQTLEVRYTNGSRYRYIGVSTAIVRGLLAAPSKGRYLAKHVRPLPYQRLG